MRDAADRERLAAALEADGDVEAAATVRWCMDEWDECELCDFLLENLDDDEGAE